MTIHESSTITSDPTVAPSSLTGLPLMLTVGEAAAGAQDQQDERVQACARVEGEPGGATGLPTVRLGGRVMVRRVDLAAIVGLGSDG